MRREATWSVSCTPRRAAIMWGLTICGAVAVAAQSAPEVVPVEPRAEVEAVLDRFHDAAARAAGESYFELFAPDAVFLGTDPGERWTVAEFREYAEPYFSRGQGWKYVPLERHVVVEGEIAWFDELLDNESYGRCRGTGVLRRSAEGWRIVHYSLTLVIPNEVARDVAERVRESAD